MKLYNALAIGLLAVNAVLIPTFTYSAVTKTPDVQPWSTISTLISDN